MAIKLVASDLDGTIISENNYIPDANYDAIKMMNNNNINFAICTGKSYSVSKNLCDKFNASYGIFNNGSQIYNLKTGDQIYSSFLQLEDVKKCFAIAKKHHLHVHAYSDELLITEKLQYLDLRNFKLQNSSEYRFVIVKNVIDYIEKNNLPIHQFVISSNTSLNSVKEEISKNVNVSVIKISKLGKYKDNILNKEYEYLSIAPSNTNKGSAIKFLTKYLSLDENDVMSIGDNLNDVDMLKNSGIGIAVANAYTELKDVAKYTTKNSASEGGFAEAVYKFIPKEKL